MKRWIMGILLLLVLAGGLPGCSGGATPTPPPDLGPNLLIETEGRVSLQRADWADYAPVSLGAEIRRGDLVRPDEGQAVKVLCADLSLHTLERKSGSPCRVTEPVLVYGSARLLAPRADPNAGQIPYLLHPRNTDVLDERPVLRWHDTGAGSYTVAILQGGKALWQEMGVQGSEMRYPDDAPALEPGVDYLLAVTDEDTGRHSGEDEAKGLGFRVLGAEERSAIEARRDEILALPLEEAARRFALAVCYAGLRLRGDALMLLDEVSADLDAPTVHLWRGELLLAMQLPLEAEGAYGAALLAAEATGDREAQAAAQAGLWQVTKDQTWLDAAIQGYEALGDQGQADALRGEGEP